MTPEDARDALLDAEADYLEANGWEEQGEIQGEEEPRWSLIHSNDPRKGRWSIITQSHAVNAQKQRDREASLERRLVKRKTQ